MTLKRFSIGICFLGVAASVQAPAFAQFDRFKPRVTIDVPTPKEVVEAEAERLQSDAQREVDGLRADAEAEVLARQDAALGNVDDTLRDIDQAQQDVQSEVDRRTRVPDTKLRLNPFGR